MKTITLRDGKERSLQRRHPWVFENSISKGKADSGETVRVQAADGSFLAWGAFSPASAIRVRAWSFNGDERIDAGFFEHRVKTAVAARARLGVASDGVRLVHGESDGLPGLIVDRYGDTLVAQFLSAGVERWKKEITDGLLRVTGLSKLYERSDAASRALEGLEEASGWLRGEGKTSLVIEENGHRYNVDIAGGHKTGFYLDQRDNRLRFEHLVKQYKLKSVLNCYCYTGGFTVAALAGGARSVVSVDSSGPALEKARANVLLNGFDVDASEFVDADVNAHLRVLIEQGKHFDAIVLDPPKFAPTVAMAERASRAYKDINRLAFKLLQPGGCADDLLVLGRHQRRPVPQDRGWRGTRRQRRRQHRRPPRRGARPCDDSDLPRRRIPEGPGDRQEIAGFGNAMAG